MNQMFKTARFSGIRSWINGIRTAKNLSSVTKDVKQTSGQTLVTDLLMNNLKNAKSVNGILEIVHSHNNVMNINHTIQALRTIFSLQRNRNSGVSTSEILNHPDFERICNQLKYYAGAIELNETIEALKVLSFLGVSSGSTIYQILLQLLRHNVNQMSLQQIIFVDFLLSKAKPTPLVEALQIALPIVYDIQLPTKLDQYNLSSLSEHLHYVSKKKISQESIMMIINCLMKVRVFNPRSSVSIMWSLCDMEPNVLFEPLLNKAIKSLLIAGQSIPYADLETVVSKMVSRYSTKNPFYFNETFFDLSANVVINEDLGFENAVHMLKKFLRVGYMNKNLLDYTSEKCHENPALIEDGDPILTYNVMLGCALTDYKPKYYNSIEKAFLRIKDFKLFINKDIHLIKFQTALAVLNIYIPEIVERALNEDYLKKIFKRNYMADFENTLLITQAVKTYKQEFNKYLPSDEFMQIVKSKIRTVSDYPLEGSLQHVFGGEKFVKTPVLTRMLHHIDHLILLRKGGFASALNPSDVHVEDIACETPNQLVLVLALRPIHYTINNQYLLGSTMLMIKTLEAKEYSVVPISITLWKSLPDFEKLPYIMEAIKSKTDYCDRVYDVS